MIGARILPRLAIYIFLIFSSCKVFVYEYHNLIFYLRMEKIIKDEPCVMHIDGRFIVIEAADGAITTNPESLVFIPKETTNEVLCYINQILSDPEYVSVKHMYILHALSVLNIILYCSLLFEGRSL